MSATLILTVLCIAVGLLAVMLALMLGLWLVRTLRWETVDDDQIEFGPRQGRAPVRGWFKGLLASRQRLLTYRRDRRGRFRRHRR